MTVDLRTIDCVRIRVPDPVAAAAYYERVFGLRELWRLDGQIGLTLCASDAEIVLYAEGGGASFPEAHYTVDDVRAAVPELMAEGCTVAVPPFKVAIGWCALVCDPFGTVLALIDTSSGRIA